MQFTHEIEQMCCVKKGCNHGPAPIPQEGNWTQSREITDISGLTHGVGWCAPQQGTCKLTLNVKNGIIEEALVETSGCSGMTHSAMRELFLQIVYGRTQSAFSEGGLPIGAGLEDLGKGLRSQIGTLYGTRAKGPRYLEMAEGYITKLALDEDGEIIGYEFVRMGPMMEMIKKGVDANEAVAKCTGNYGRFDEAAKYIDPRHE